MKANKKHLINQIESILAKGICDMEEIDYTSEKLIKLIWPYFEYYENQNKEPIECKWIYDGDDCWESQCGQSFIFNDKGPIHNGFKYCPYCGGKMIQNEKEN